MLLSEARTLLKRYGFDENDPIDLWLKGGLLEFCNTYDWPFNHKTLTVTQPANSGLVSLPGIPEGLVKTIIVKDLTNDKKLTYMEPTRFYRELETAQLDSGGAQYYTVTGGNLGSGSGTGPGIILWPNQSVDASYWVLYQGFSSFPSNGSDPLPIPDPCCQSVVTAAAIVALQSENEEERAQTEQAMFDSQVARLINRYNPDHRDEPSQVVDTQGYF